MPEHGLLIYVTANCVGHTCSSDPCSMRLRDVYLYYHGLIYLSAPKILLISTRLGVA
jgi:hypothetical protein